MDPLPALTNTHDEVHDEVNMPPPPKHLIQAITPLPLSPPPHRGRRVMVPMPPHTAAHLDRCDRLGGLQGTRELEGPQIVHAACRGKHASDKWRD